jgi:hypothetical protein
VEFIIGGAAVVIIVLLWLRLDAVTSQRDNALADRNKWQAAYEEQAYLLKEGTAMREQAIRNAEEYWEAQQEDPRGE